MKAEEVKIGGYQFITLFLLSVNLIIVAMSHALTIFYKFTPKFYCQVNKNEDINPNNRTYGCLKNGCIGQYEFETTKLDKSVAMEWNLICEREPLLKAAGDVYLGGLLLGALVAGFIADRIGRFPVLAVCLYAQGTMAVALNVVQEFELFLVFRGLQGFFIQGLESCTFILCMELFPKRFRTLIALIVLSMRSVGLALLSGLSYAILDWRILQLVVSVPTAITVLYIWLLPESPRWLIAKKKLTEAEILLEKIINYNDLCGLRKAKNNHTEKIQEQKQCNDEQIEKPQKPKRKNLNDLNSSSDVEKSIEESENLLSSFNQNNDISNEKMDKNTKRNSSNELNIDEIDRTSNRSTADETSFIDEKNDGDNETYVMDSDDVTTNDKNKIKSKFCSMNFFKKRFMGRTCLIMMLLWFIASTAFHALITLPHRLTMERHVSLTVAAGMELLTFAVCYLLISLRCGPGRRISLCISQILAGIACITIAIVAGPLPIATKSDWLVHLKTAIVTIGRISNIGTFFILRILVIELFPTISRGTAVGLCVSAEMLGGLLTPFILMLNNYLLELSRYSVGFLCICAAFITFIFPETSHIILPDTIEEARDLKAKNKISMDEECSAAQLENPEVLRDKLFSEDWVDAGNGIIVNFTDSKNTE